MKFCTFTDNYDNQVGVNVDQVRYFFESETRLTKIVFDNECSIYIQASYEEVRQAFLP